MYKVTPDVSIITIVWYTQMYMGGTLLFIGHAFSPHSCSERDLQKQISRIRVDYRLGTSLPSDYKFRYCPTETSLQVVITPTSHRSLYIVNTNKRIKPIIFLKYPFADYFDFIHDLPSSLQ